MTRRQALRHGPGTRVLVHVHGANSEAVIRRHGQDERGLPLVAVDFADDTEAEIKPREILRALPSMPESRK